MVRRRKWVLFPKIDTTSLLKTKYIVNVGRPGLEILRFKILRFKILWFKILS